MLKLSAAVHKKQMKFDEKLHHIFFFHPYFALFLVGIAAPVIVLAAVFLAACLFTLPLGLIFGWL